MTRPVGLRAELEQLRSEMTAAGSSRLELVIELRSRYGMRPREAWRQALGWSAQQVADHINTLGATRPACAIAADASLIAKWEKWPSRSGRRPTMNTLALLAEAYGCGIADLIDAMAYIVIANRSFTDVYQWGRRTIPLSLAAEIQHRLLPASLACEAAQFAVAGALKPADHVGGDTFDYVIDRDTVQLSVTDAMAHDVDAALLATLLVGALRRARRAGADLAEQARQAMREHGRQGYVTGQLLRISLIDGKTEFINAGPPGRCGCGTDRCGRSLRRSICRSASMSLTPTGSSRWTCGRATGW